MPSYVLVKRLNDNAAGWAECSNTRFSSSNECDFILFDDNTRTFYGLELKSTKEKSLTYWREDFEDKDKKQTFMIRKCQINGLRKWSRYNNCICGFVINFRSLSNRTFFIAIDDFLEYTSVLSKKSINFDDVLKMKHVNIENTLVRTNYRYNIECFLKR